MNKDELPKNYKWRTYWGITWTEWEFVWGLHDTHRWPYQSVLYKIGPLWVHRKVKRKGE